jgi:hypothetical protein
MTNEIWKMENRSAPLINTQLQLGGDKPSVGPLNRFNGFADDAVQTVENSLR